MFTIKELQSSEALFIVKICQLCMKREKLRDTGDIKVEVWDIGFPNERDYLEFYTTALRNST